MREKVVDTLVHKFLARMYHREPRCSLLNLHLKLQLYKLMFTPSNKKGKTKREMGGLYQGVYGGSGSDGGGGTGSSKMEEEGSHRRTQLNWEKPAEEEVK